MVLDPAHTGPGDLQRTDVEHFRLWENALKVRVYLFVCYLGKLFEDGIDRPADMGRKHDVWQAAQRTIRRKRLISVNIESCAGQTTVPKSVDQRNFVDDRAAGGVDQDSLR